jgi:hypothetical protein
LEYFSTTLFPGLKGFKQETRLFHGRMQRFTSDKVSVESYLKEMYGDFQIPPTGKDIIPYKKKLQAWRPTAGMDVRLDVMFNNRLNNISNIDKVLDRTGDSESIGCSNKRT